MQIVDWETLVREKSNGKLEFLNLIWDKEKNRSYLYLKCEKHGKFRHAPKNVRLTKDVKCPKCKQEEKDEYWSLETARNEINKVEPDYIVKDIRKNETWGNKEILVSCGKHEFYWTSINTFINLKARCKQCFFDANNRTEWDNKTCLSFIHSLGYTISGEKNIKGLYSKFDMKDSLGYKYNNNISNLIKSTPLKFSKNNPYTIENIKLWIKINRPDYELISDLFETSRTKMKFKYIGKFIKTNENLRYFEMMWKCFKEGQRNPNLRISIAEEVTHQFLTENNIPFDFQQSFEDCINPETGCRLRYDFLIKDDKGNYTKNIETNGDQHEIIIDYWGGEEALKKQKFRDKIKDNYMKKLNISLIKIKQKDFKNIPEILTKILLKEAI